ncbi:high affinity immunoglobulin epsilon receptor subunit gamma [Clupea harengus]|uniref:high affinity immunoglobulin epsilon receptor subunit gamma n=1 Tax=Clupea harengus TaxID=7950 RepID=UPI0012ABDC2D|nr:high affinity immunoglobulin epsilon receptor subunit gamma [Clupea harengus]
MKATRALLAALPLWMCFGHADAISEPQICYILDSILFLYGLILTVLYCRLKWVQKNSSYPVKKQPEGIYEGLSPHDQDTYETIQLKKGMK